MGDQVEEEGRSGRPSSSLWRLSCRQSRRPWKLLASPTSDLGKVREAWSVSASREQGRRGGAREGLLRQVEDLIEAGVDGGECHYGG